MKSDNSFLKGTLILTVSSIVVKVIGALRRTELDIVEPCAGRGGHRSVPDGFSHLPDGDHGFLGRHTGGDFHRDGGKSCAKRL